MAIIEFTIHTDAPIETAALFDRIQVWRSATQNGTYADITSNDPTPATLDGTNPGPWNLNGKVLTVLLNGADAVSMTFTGTDPFTLGAAIAQINATFPLLASPSPVNAGRIRLQSSIDGTQSILQVAGNATASFGLINTHINGKAPRLLLSEHTTDYLFRDYDSDPSFWYKTRFYSSVTNTVSDFSAPRQGGQGAGLISQTVIGSASLSDITGTPIVGKRLVFVPTDTQVLSDGSGNNFGIFPSAFRVEAVTDNNGQIKIALVRGQRLKVFIEGTPFQREFVVPTTDFDILTVATTADDPLDIVTSPPMPIRMS
jgi:hypothetical protein